MTGKKQTPMMRQYQHLKQQYKDKILLFRMGDFFETFGDDAKTISRVLSIALTTRDKNDDPTPLAGFPHHAIDQYLPKLVKAGYNVAVADQVEDASQAKGIVRREVIRVVTPGTLTNDKTQDETQNNYLVSIFINKKNIGIASCDLATGEFRITETTNPSTAKAEFARLSPSEILISPKQDFSHLANYPLQPLEEYRFELSSAKDLLTSQFNVKSLASFGINKYEAGIIAAGAITHYLQNTQKSEIPHIKSIQYYDINGNMTLDEATIRNLDLVYSTGEHGTKSTLFSVLNYTQNSMGARLLRKWILHPLLDLQNIRQRQDCIEELVSEPELLNNSRELLQEITDLERTCGKLGLNRANARDLLSLNISLTNSLELVNSLKDNKAFSKITRGSRTAKAKIKDIIKLINDSINENPPNTITEGGIIKDGCNKEIDSIRNETKDSKDWIKNLEETERNRTGIPSLKVRFNKVFGYYIEITHTHKDKVPEDYERKQTLVNSERYITPELKKKEEIVLNAEEKLAKLEYECFQEIREKILKNIKEMLDLAEIIAQIDTLASLAEAARLNDFIRPILYDFRQKDGIINIKNSRHPVVEKNINEEFICNDVHMDSKSNRLQILTGPNMSGKSTYIRQIALILLMAQTGSFVPASSAEISMTDRIFTRVGASDDISAGRSTFLVEMDEAANIINNATQHSLVVLDEIGRGTSTYDGVAIAWAIAEYIHDNIGARCVFATHYHELLKLESELEGVKNYNIAVLEENDKITFLRKVEKGGTDKSYGIFVAQMAGLPEVMINRANEILSGFEQENMFGVRSDPVKKEKSTKGKEDTDTLIPDNQHQLSFIDGAESNDIPNIFKELESIDPHNITPIEALRILEKWKKRFSR